MRIQYIIFIAILLLPVAFSYPYLCCKDPNTLQPKCYVSGECCNGKWYNKCYDFQLWSVNGKYTIGTPSTINIYVRNIGGYDDSYRISRYQILSGNINIDSNSLQKSITISPNYVGVLQPSLIFLSNQQAQITFYVVSKTGTEKSITVTMSADSMYSMPEFSNIFIILIIFSGVFLIYRKV